MAEGVTAGVVAAVLWALFVWGYRRWINWRVYHDLNGEYEVTAKTGVEYAKRFGSRSNVGAIASRSSSTTSLQETGYAERLR
jgi:hypothetical protein